MSVIFDSMLEPLIEERNRLLEEVAEWRSLATKLLFEFDGVYREDRPLNVEIPWEQLEFKFPFPGMDEEDREKYRNEPENE